MKNEADITDDPVLSELLRKHPKKQPVRKCPCCKRRIPDKLYQAIMGGTNILIRAGVKLLNRGRADCGMCGTPKRKRRAQ